MDNPLGSSDPLGFFGLSQGRLSNSLKPSGNGVDDASRDSFLAEVGMEGYGGTAKTPVIHFPITIGAPFSTIDDVFSHNRPHSPKILQYSQGDEETRIFLGQLGVVVEEINTIKREKVSYEAVAEDVKFPNAEKKLAAGLMPHYITCYGISDLIKYLLEKRCQIATEYTAIEIQPGEYHICLSITLGGQQYFITWVKDNIFILHSDFISTEIARLNEKPLGTTFQLQNTTREEINQAMSDKTVKKFVTRRVNWVFRQSINPVNDPLLKQEITAVHHIEDPIGLFRYYCQTSENEQLSGAFIQHPDGNGTIQQDQPFPREYIFRHRTMDPVITDKNHKVIISWSPN